MHVHIPINTFVVFIKYASLSLRHSGKYKTEYDLKILSIFGQNMPSSSQQGII